MLRSTADVTEMFDLKEEYGLGVFDFAQALTKKLLKNKRKGDSWRQMHLWDLFGQKSTDYVDGEPFSQEPGGLEGEVEELDEALEHKGPDGIQGECLDVAAFALMIWQKIEDGKPPVNNNLTEG